MVTRYVFNVCFTKLFDRKAFLQTLNAKTPIIHHHCWNQGPLPFNQVILQSSKQYSESNILLSLQQVYSNPSWGSVEYVAMCAVIAAIFQSGSSSGQISSSAQPCPFTHHKLQACSSSLLPGLVMTYGLWSVLHLAVNYIMLQSVVKLRESSANAASPMNQFPLSCPVQRSQPLGRLTRCYYFSPHSSQEDTLQMQHVHQSLREDFKSVRVMNTSKTPPGNPERTIWHESIREMAAQRHAGIEIRLAL